MTVAFNVFALFLTFLSVGLCSFWLGRLVERQRSTSLPRSRGYTGIHVAECVTCRCSTSAIDKQTISADSVDEFLKRHQTHAVRLQTRIINSARLQRRA